LSGYYRDAEQILARRKWSKKEAKGPRLLKDGLADFSNRLARES
jgi:hypothetical protein